MRVLITNSPGEIVCVPLVKKERFPPGSVVIVNRRAELRTVSGVIALCNIPAGFKHYSTATDRIVFRDGAPIPKKLSPYEILMNRIKKYKKNEKTLF